MNCCFRDLFAELNNFIINLQLIAPTTSSSDGTSIHGMTVFILACFVGYYVVWKVTPALHAPLMSVTNAISSVIIVGAILATSQNIYVFSRVCGFFAIVLASVNIFGGFIVTHRMLDMFRRNR
ncbi:MAG: proton-translocating transhydrogenase family protein [Holosporaceae bacterium]|jgi:NAD(P) transhydrogenase subunit alpha|nr:proton-translocating transhydrogenase family protein [Holosporaceae bacterium]